MPRRVGVALAAGITVFAIVVTLIFVDSLGWPWSPYMDSAISRYVLPAIVVTCGWTVAAWAWVEALRKTAQK